MIRSDLYFYDGYRATWEKAKKRKDELRYSGWRVQVRKTRTGGFDIWKKRRDVIDSQNHDRRSGNKKFQHERGYL